MTEDRRRFGMIPVWVLGHPDLTNGHKVVYCSLSSYADTYRTCYPSIRKIAGRARVSERYVSESLRVLESVGAVVTHQRDGRSSFYVLPWEPFESELGGDEAEFIPATKPAGNALSFIPGDESPLTPWGDPLFTQGGTVVHPEETTEDTTEETTEERARRQMSPCDPRRSHETEDFASRPEIEPTSRRQRYGPEVGPLGLANSLDEIRELLGPHPRQESQTCELCGDELCSCVSIEDAGVVG